MHPSPDDQGVVSEDFIKEEIRFKSNQRPSVLFSRKSIIVSLSRVVRVEFVKCMHEPSRAVGWTEIRRRPAPFFCRLQLIMKCKLWLESSRVRLALYIGRFRQERTELGTLRSGYQIMSFEILEVHSPPLLPLSLRGRFSLFLALSPPQKQDQRNFGTSEEWAK